MGRTLRLLGIALALVIAGACRSRPVVPEVVAFQFGTYTLETVNDQRLPVQSAVGDIGRDELLSAELTLERDASRNPDNPGGDFTLVHTRRFLPRGNPPVASRQERATGAFFATPKGLLLRFHGTGSAPDYTATVDGGRITFTLRAQTYVYSL